MLFHRLKTGSFLALLLSFAAPPSMAVTDYEPSSIPFTRELADIKASLSPTVEDDLKKITIPLKKLRLRLVNPKKDPTIEAIGITVPRSETGLKDVVRKLADSGKEGLLAESLLKKIKKAESSKKSSVRIHLDADDAPLLNLRALAKELAKENHLVTLDSKELVKEGVWKDLREQLGFILSKEQLAKIHRKVKAGAELSLEDDLLPPFSRKMAGKFIVYRGPNCFHASLSFFDQHMPRNPEVNIKEEEGYHRAMINYDELWRVISYQFYEIDPRSTPLKYGDLMVYFQVPEKPAKNIHFKWIRHASVYLFGPYVYSKGSKSPNTPYSVKTLGEEWKTWQDMVPKSLGVRIYRRGAAIGRHLPQGRDNWIY